jgi:hypothetical protein
MVSYDVKNLNALMSYCLNNLNALVINTHGIDNYLTITTRTALKILLRVGTSDLLNIFCNIFDLKMCPSNIEWPNNFCNLQVQSMN